MPFVNLARVTWWLEREHLDVIAASLMLIMLCRVHSHCEHNQVDFGGTREELESTYGMPFADFAEKVIPRKQHTCLPKSFRFIIISRSCPREYIHTPQLEWFPGIPINPSGHSPCG